MSKVKSFISGHKKLLITAVVLIVIITLIVSVFAGGPPAQGAALTQDTTLLAKTSLSQIVTGSGTVQSTSEKNVTSSLSYQITEVLVEVGDTVTAGQQLVVLDTTDLETSISETQAAINSQGASDSLSLQQAQRKLQDAIDQRDIDYVKYENQVLDAQWSLDDARYELEWEQAVLQEYADRCDAAREAHEADKENAELLAAYSLAQAEYDAARANYDMLEPGLTSAVSMAETALETAKSTQQSMNRQNEQTVQSYQDTVDTLSIGDNTRTQRNQLASYQRQLENAVITAPISGTVTAVNAEVGGTPMSSVSALFTIEDTQSLEVPISVAEYDISDVQVGMKAEVTSDALDGEVWLGTVQSISPTATDTAGNFTVTIKITGQPGLLKSGMSAKANIVIEEKEGIYAVPFDAVVETAAGGLVVYEYLGFSETEGADRREIPVTTGMEGDYYIEIVSPELYEGIEILNDPLGVNVTQSSGFGFMGGGF